MKVQCKLIREGGTKVDIDNIEYHFKPNAKSEHVAEVTNKEHLARFLSISEGYTLPDDDEPAKPAAKKEPQKPLEHVNLQGSDWEPKEVDLGDGKTVATAELVGNAFSASGLTADAWNALPKEEVESALTVALEAYKAEPELPAKPAKPAAKKTAKTV